MSPIPLFITDLDHTFLRTDQSVSAFSTQVWNEKTKENILSIATARSFQKSLDFLETLHLKSPMILLDGSMIVTPEKKCIDLQYIDKNLGDAIIFEGEKFHIKPFIITLKNIKNMEEAFLFPTTLNSHQNRVLQNYHNDPRMVRCDEIRAMEMNLKLVYFGDYATLQPLTQYLQKTFGSQLEYKLSPEKYSDGWFLTLLHPKGDKAHALKKLVEYLGKEMQHVTVFGDSINDIEMFKVAGHAVAVANALDEVKAVADTILPHTNDEDAVAHYLAQLS